MNRYIPPQKIQDPLQHKEAVRNARAILELQKKAEAWDKERKKQEELAELSELLEIRSTALETLKAIKKRSES